MPDIPAPLVAELARLGVVLPAPKVKTYPKPWLPEYEGEEPPF